MQSFFGYSFTGNDASSPKYSAETSRMSARNPRAKNPYSYPDDVARRALETHKVLFRINVI